MFVGPTGVTRGDSSGRRGEVSVGQEAVPQRRGGEQHCIEQPRCSGEKRGPLRLREYSVVESDLLIHSNVFTAQ